MNPESVARNKSISQGLALSEGQQRRFNAGNETMRQCSTDSSASVAHCSLPALRALPAFSKRVFRLGCALLIACIACIACIGLSPAHAANWYVNDAVYNASDSFTYAVGNNTNAGSAAAPFRDIPKAVSAAAAGDTIYIDAGLYDSYVRISATETAGVNIAVDSLTLIGKDSNATVIDPPGANSVVGLYGIYADTQTGLRIKSLGVTGAYDGIHLVNVDMSTITGDSVSRCGHYGVYLLNGSDTNTVSGNVSISNVYGFELESNSNGNTVNNNTANSNVQAGIYLYSGSNSNTVTGNITNSNATIGINMNVNANNNTVSNNILCLATSRRWNDDRQDEGNPAKPMDGRERDGIRNNSTPGTMATIYASGGAVDVFKNVEAFMTVNGSGLVSARKSRFSEMRKSAPTHSAYAPIRASAGLRPQLRYAAMRAEGTASSSSITHPMLFQKRWHSFNNTAGMLRPTSATTNRGRNTLARPAATAAAAFLSSSSQSALRSAPKAYTYSLLSRTRRKPFLKNFVSGFLDSGQDLAPGHAFEWRTVFFNVRPCPVQGGESSRQINPAILFFRHFQSCCLTHTDTVLNPPGQVKAAAA